MTSARNFRVKGRFWIGICLILIALGFVAIFHGQTQLETSRQKFLRCEQQQIDLNIQMRSLKDHKLKLERSLDSERKEHLETKATLEQQIKEQKDTHGKNVMDAANRYENLQQKYKALQEQITSMKEEYMKKKNNQGEEIVKLERKAKSLTKDSDMWKIKYENATAENKRLQKMLSESDNISKVQRLELELLDYKNHCQYKSTLTKDSKIESRDHPLNKPLVEKSFSEQKLVSENVYEIQIKSVVGQTTANPLKRMALKSLTNSPKGQGIINSVENFQIAPQEIQVIQSPPALKSPSLASSSSSSSTQGPANQEPSPASIAKRSSVSSRTTTKRKTIPSDLGIAPVPEIPDDLQDMKEDSENAANNRYSNVMNELSAKNIENDGADEENGAFEHKDLQEVLDDANPGAGVDDLNDEMKRNNDHHGELEDDEIDLGKNHGALEKKNKNEHLLDDSLNNEVAGDHGKELQDELRIADEPMNEEDEDEDADDYANHEAHQKEGPAIRN